jgi:hypothetical protein
MKAEARMHPETLYARMRNEATLILRVENTKSPRWVEAEVHVPEKISLAASAQLRKGRMRVGIVGKNQALEKSVKIYASEYTDAQSYDCKLIVFTYDRDGVIDERIEVPFRARCEEQKPAVI